MRPKFLDQPHHYTRTPRTLPNCEQLGQAPNLFGPIAYIVAVAGIVALLYLVIAFVVGDANAATIPGSPNGCRPIYPRFNWAWMHMIFRGIQP